MTAPSNPIVVSSFAHVIAGCTGGLTLVPPADLRLWLPDLTVPQGWVRGTDSGARVTRFLLRRLGDGRDWDGCEVLKLYRVPGVVPETVVLETADRILRDSGATDIRTHRVDIPAHNGLIGVRSSGDLGAGPRRVHSYFHYYMVKTAASYALIEQTILIGADVGLVLGREVADLTDDIYRSLLTSIDRVRRPSDS
jgi:hypothetical protein